MVDTSLVFNGLDVKSGAYLLPPMEPVEFGKLLKGAPQDQEFNDQLLRWLNRRRGNFLGTVASVDPRDISSAGWGVIFAAGASPAITEALRPLLDLRKQQAGPYYQEYLGARAYRPSESKAGWLARQGAAADGPANPDKVPYYLLIVGDPQTIPYSFQYQLDVQYAVGRIHFDTLAEYDYYARSVVAAETGRTVRRPHAMFFGVSNADDYATSLSSTKLVKPLAQALAKGQGKWKNQPRWRIDQIVGEQATRSKLLEILGGASTPALVFTASHGLGGFDAGTDLQLRQQGALVCQDWPGPIAGQGAPILPDYFVAAEHIAESAQVAGIIAFHFACYGAGTPQWDDFTQQALHHRIEIAASPFVASLPKRLLAGGALAVIGHVERAWGYSFLGAAQGGQLTQQTDVFESTLTQLMQGYPVGMALEYFNVRFAELAVRFKEEQDDISYGKEVSYEEVADLWMANNDARNFVIVGDPAVRLAVAEGPDDKLEALLPSTLSRTPIIQQSVLTPLPTVEPQPHGLPTAHAIPAAARQAEPTFTQEQQPAYWLWDRGDSSTQNAGRGLVDTLQQLTTKLSVTIQNAIEDISSLEVATYVSADMEGVTYEDGKFTGPARLRALTRINLDGDSAVCVPEKDGQIDKAVWEIHLEMVTKAQAHRAELLKLSISAIRGLVDAVKGL